MGNNKVAKTKPETHTKFRIHMAQKLSAKGKLNIKDTLRLELSCLSVSQPGKHGHVVLVGVSMSNTCQT